MQQLFMTKVPKCCHSGTKGCSLYFQRICCSRCDIQDFVDSRMSSNQAGSYWKVLRMLIILVMQYLYSSFELMSLPRTFGQTAISQLLKCLLLLSSEGGGYGKPGIPSWFFQPESPSAKRLRRQMRALGCLKRGSLGSLLWATSLANLLTNFLNSLGSQRGMLKSQRMRRRWNSFFFILEFISILFDMLEVRAAKLILSWNQLWLRTLQISPRETTFLPSKLQRVPTQAQQCPCSPNSLRCSMSGMKMFLGQFFSKARWGVARACDQECYSQEDSLGKPPSAFSISYPTCSFFTNFMWQPRIKIKNKLNQQTLPPRPAPPLNTPAPPQTPS